MGARISPLSCTSVSVLLLGVAVANVSYADSSNSSASVTPSSGDAVKAGDIIHFRSAAPIFTKTPFSGGAPVSAVGAAPAAGAARAAGVAPAADSTIYCSLPDSVFQVQSITAASTSTGNEEKGTTAPANAQLVYGAFPTENWVKRLLHLFPRKPDDTSGATACGTYSTIQADVPYQFNASDISKVVSQRMGFTWGALVIPYKYYFTDKSIKGNPSTVAYAGYEGWFPGVSLAFVGSAGLGVAPASSNTSNSSGSITTSGSSTTSSSTVTAATYTLAIGFIATFGGSIKGGLMFGRDYQGDASDFKYENKTWMALSVGTSF
jgi:hypothetical protein